MSPFDIEPMTSYWCSNVTTAISIRLDITTQETRRLTVTGDLINVSNIFKGFDIKHRGFLVWPVWS